MSFLAYNLQVKLNELVISLLMLVQKRNRIKLVKSGLNETYPKTTQQMPVVKIPQLNTRLGFN